MGTQLNNGTIIFGDGTVQSTKTPSNVSAFTNDSVYLVVGYLIVTVIVKL